MLVLLKFFFSSSATSFKDGYVTWNFTGDAVGGNATIYNDDEMPIIKDLTATFTGAGQSVSYIFYAYNAGAYDAYLTNIKFNNVDGESSSKVCTAIDSSSVTSSLLEATCNDINVSIDVGATTTVMGSTNDISGHILGRGIFEEIVVTISYADNSNLADGDFKVEFGDIGLTYSTVDNGLGLINFSYNGENMDYDNLVAEEGMTWGEWVESDYNTVGAFINGRCVYFDENYPVEMTSKDDVIKSEEYTFGPSYCSIDDSESDELPK